jgi:hypothetical protein
MGLIPPPQPSLKHICYEITTTAKERESKEYETPVDGSCNEHEGRKGTQVTFEGMNGIKKTSWKVQRKMDEMYWTEMLREDVELENVGRGERYLKAED